MKGAFGVFYDHRISLSLKSMFYKTVMMHGAECYAVKKQ